MKSIRLARSQLQLLPSTPGVYLFTDSADKTIYVGKAIDIKKRLTSYFSKNLGDKTRAMVSSAAAISYIPVDCEINALLLEAKLVKKYQPRFNIELRDDKSPLYIGITSEPLPRVLCFRQTQLSSVKLKACFGPFTNSQAPKKVLRALRNVFPYSTHTPGKRPCLYSQIGLCSPCPSSIVSSPEPSKKELTLIYKKNIRRLKSVLSGNSTLVRKHMEREMAAYSKKHLYEEALSVKNKIAALNYVTERRVLSSGYIENPNLLEDIREEEVTGLTNIVQKYYNVGRLSRIECFDIAHFAGSYPTASMVTFINGEPEKSLYRHYKVSDTKLNNDPEAMKLILEKRARRTVEWGMPDLLIVDGGKSQVSAALKAIDMVPVVGLAKREETLIFNVDGEFKEIRLPASPARNLVQRVRNEAHRFARRYHHLLVKKAITNANIN